MLGKGIGHEELEEGFGVLDLVESGAGVAEAVVGGYEDVVLALAAVC